VNAKILNLISATLIALLPTIALANQTDKQLQTYLQQGATQIEPENGKRLWNANNNGRSCTNCHGDTPRSLARHIKTRKPIQPMAPSVAPERYQDSKKVEKWFLRNCKWTLGRTCTVQEKADILTWLSGQ
jgi:hypothetical protein